MQFDIENHWNGDLDREWLTALNELLPLYAGQEGLPDALSIGLTFVDAEEIRAVNREFRGIDSVTDVLSFPICEPEEKAEMRKAEEALLAKVDASRGV